MKESFDVSWPSRKRAKNGLGSEFQGRVILSCRSCVDLLLRVELSCEGTNLYDDAYDALKRNEIPECSS